MTHLIGIVTFLAEESGKTETPHAWWPEPYEIIWGTLATVVIAAALWKFAIPQLRRALEARTARIQRELDSSVESLNDAQASATRIRASRGDLQAERTRLLAEADRTAEQVEIEGRKRIESEAAAAQTKTSADIDAARTRVQSEVHATMARIAAVAVEDVVGAALDEATQQRLIEDFIANVGASR